MPLIPYPNIPFGDGVPPIPRLAVNYPKQLLIAANLAANVIQIANSLFQEWGILDSGGQTVIQPDSFISIENINERHIANYPVEQGGFVSYNKVAMPAQVKLMLACGGKNMNQDAFLAQLAGMRDDLNLYTIVTPDVVFPNMNLQRFNYRRDSTQGMTLLNVECHFQEIRNTAVNTTAPTAQPDGATTLNDGIVSPQTPSASFVSTVGVIQ